jgi:hypothetical protein
MTESQHPFRSQLQEILDGIRLEIAATPKQFVFLVEDVRQTRDLYTVTVSFEDSPARGLDESLEGAAAWWPGTIPGHGDVLAKPPWLCPHCETGTLRFASGTSACRLIRGAFFRFWLWLGGLGRDPPERVTWLGVAVSIGASPMSIYRNAATK